MTEIKIKSLAHAALKVKGLDRSLAFYRDTLGFKEMMRINNEDGSLLLVYLRMADTQFIEIFPGGEGDIAPGWNANAINHFCLEVDDIQAICCSASGTPHRIFARTQDGHGWKLAMLDR